MSSMLDIDVKPPTYDHTVSDARVQLSCGELPTLFLDRTTIFANSDPPRALYELSNPVCEAKSNVYGVQKVAYRVSSAAGSDRVRTRLDHIYDFSVTPVLSLNNVNSQNAVIIEGKMNSRRTYKENILMPGATSWKVKDHFKAGQSVIHQMKHENQIHWKNMEDKVIAVETVAQRDEQKNLVGFPKLEIKVAMEDKELDLLVATWMARVWRQSADELEEPMSWEDFKQMSKWALAGHTWRLSLNRWTWFQ